MNGAAGSDHRKGAGDRATLAFYEAEAPRYTLSGTRGPSRHLDDFLDRLTAGGYILELGCGAGRDALHMIARGFTVDATDGASAMVRKARERLGGGVRAMRFDQLRSQAVYDGIWAHASLLHVAQSELPFMLARIRTALKPGGWHWASYKLGRGEARDRFGRFYNNPAADDLRALYEAVGGWRLDQLDQFDGMGYDGEPVRWGAALLQRARASR